MDWLFSCFYTVAKRHHSLHLASMHGIPRSIYILVEYECLQVLLRLRGSTSGRLLFDEMKDGSTSAEEAVATPCVVSNKMHIGTTGFSRDFVSSGSFICNCTEFCSRSQLSGNKLSCDASLFRPLRSPCSVVPATSFPHGRRTT